MKHLTKISFLLILFATISCNGSSNLSSEQLNSFESELTAGGVFWQSEYGSYIDFLFKEDGKVHALTNGRINSILVGKWSFNKTSGELQIAWEGGQQYASTVENIGSNWETITFSLKIHEFGDKTLTRLKLLDDRFIEKK